MCSCIIHVFHRAARARAWTGSAKLPLILRRIAQFWDAEDGDIHFSASFRQGLSERGSPDSNGHPQRGFCCKFFSCGGYGITFQPLAGRFQMFKGRHFDRSLILLCVRWYRTYGLSLRDLKEMMAERGINIDHSTIHRWGVYFSPLLLERFNWCKRP